MRTRMQGHWWTILEAGCQLRHPAQVCLVFQYLPVSSGLCQIISISIYIGLFSESAPCVYYRRSHQETGWNWSYSSVLPLRAMSGIMYLSRLSPGFPCSCLGYFFLNSSLSSNSPVLCFFWSFDGNWEICSADLTINFLQPSWLPYTSLSHKRFLLHESAHSSSCPGKGSPKSFGFVFNNHVATVWLLLGWAGAIACGLQ